MQEGVSYLLGSRTRLRQQEAGADLRVLGRKSRIEDEFDEPFACEMGSISSDSEPPTAGGLHGNEACMCLYELLKMVVHLDQFRSK